MRCSIGGRQGSRHARPGRSGMLNPGGYGAKTATPDVPSPCRRKSSTRNGSRDDRRHRYREDGKSSRIVTCTGDSRVEPGRWDRQCALARPPARPSPALERAVRSGRAGRWLVTPQLNNGGAIQGTGRNSTPAATDNYDQSPGQMRQIPHPSGGRKMHIASPAYVQGDGSGCLNHGD